MFKCSTAGDRKFALREIPMLMTELEMMLPQTWNTTVVHLYTFHTILILLLAGPFCVNNMFKVITHTLCSLAHTHTHNHTNSLTHKDKHCHTHCCESSLALFKNSYYLHMSSCRLLWSWPHCLQATYM